MFTGDEKFRVQAMPLNQSKFSGRKCEDIDDLKREIQQSSGNKLQLPKIILYIEELNIYNKATDRPKT